jgi:hypothetical protein
MSALRAESVDALLADLDHKPSSRALDTRVGASDTSASTEGNP